MFARKLTCLLLFVIYYFSHFKCRGRPVTNTKGAIVAGGCCAISPTSSTLELKRLQITCVERSIHENLAEILVTIECTTRNEELVRNNADELK